MRRVPIVLMFAAVLASCSTSAGQSADSGTSASSADAPADPIPLVRDPKTLVGTPPCALLTSAQLANNRMDLPGQSRDVLGAPGCEWDNKAHTREIAMYVEIGRDVLRNVYAQRETFPVFEITEVTGHPAVRTKDLVEGPSCTFRVAVAERQTFVIEFTSLRQGLEEPCGPARALAEAVIGNLPPLKS